MYTRALDLPNRSFFLFGPRGTGKTTWLRQKFTDCLYIDLLKTVVQRDHLRDPELLRMRVEGAAKDWVVIDEIQKLPRLLDDVHSLMNDYGDRYRFALTGSSARKLKRAGVNLLAGRAVNRAFFPLVGHEMDYQLDPATLLRYGMLPAVDLAPSDAERIDVLRAYAANYVFQEVQQEALVKDIDSFHRFLEIAALCHGQIVNVAGIARDAGVARTTVQGYFDLLVDTLIGVWLPAWRPRSKIKETAKPKFYFFDPGVTRACAGDLTEPPPADREGFLLEAIVLNELRAWDSYHQLSGRLSYWRTPSGSEIDFVWEKGRRRVGFEVKAGRRWRAQFGTHLKQLHAQGQLSAAYGVYQGSEALRDGPVSVLPLQDLMREAASGSIFR